MSNAKEACAHEKDAWGYCAVDCRLSTRTELPVSGQTVTWVPPQSISLRDWFAGQALQGLGGNDRQIVSAEDTFAKFAQWAYAQADAMLAERTKEKK